MRVEFLPAPCTVVCFPLEKSVRPSTERWLPLTGRTAWWGAFGPYISIVGPVGNASFHGDCPEIGEIMPPWQIPTLGWQTRQTAGAR